MIVYNQGQHVPQYCEGADWRAMGPMPGAGGAGCADPSGAESVILYNAGDRVMQYCDGTDWIAMGPVQDDVTDGLAGWWKLDGSLPPAAPSRAALSATGPSMPPTWAPSARRP